MTNPSKDQDSRESGLEATTEAPVGSPPEPGSQASRTWTQSGTAGGASQEAPRQFTAEEVFATLADAIAALEAAGKIPLAAGVSARMRLMRPEFAIEKTPFASFREITRAAEAAGIVEATRGANDFILRLVSFVADPDFRGMTLRPDLWRAMQDWGEGRVYVFDRSSKLTKPFDGVKSPDTVQVPKVDRADVISWMGDFVEHFSGAGHDSLRTALTEQDPVVGFHRVAGESEELKRSWTRFLRKRVLEAASHWAQENGIPQAHIFQTTPAAIPPLAAPASVASPTSALSLASPEEAALRLRMLRILEGMPLHELLRLPIPLEYALIR